MRYLAKKFKKILITSLCLVFAMSVMVLTPEVDAASETPITETKQTETTNDTINKDDALALARAIAIDEAKVEAENALKELATVQAQETEVTESDMPQEEETYASSSQETSSGSTTSTSSNSTYVSGATGTDYLIDIDNPDPNYTSYAIHLSDADRDLAGRVIMGEADNSSYLNMALVAQCLRDAFVRGGYSSIQAVADGCGYYGSRSKAPNQTCKDVVDYIFEQGGAAVQHRLLVFYASDYCSSSWHESQNYICSYGAERFFDIWD